MRTRITPLLVLFSFYAADVRAQAWLPPKGSLSLAVSHTDYMNRYHYLPDGGVIDVGHTRTYSQTLSVSWSPASRLMLTVALPYVRAEYHGARPHVGTDIDDGHDRGTMTDLRVAAHFQWREQPLALAPYVALVIPTHDYPALGHASPGRHLKEQLLGLFVGKSFDAWIPRSYAQARLQYGFVEKVAGISHDRSNIDLELGWFATPRLSLRLLGSWQQTHGGIDVPVPPSNPLYPYHDQLASERFIQVGAGVAGDLTKHDSWYLTYRRSVKGQNGHKLDNGFGLGFSHTFGKN